MSASVDWPSNLPQQFLIDNNYQETPPQNATIRTPMDAAIAKTRKRYSTTTTNVSGDMLLTLAEYRDIFKPFYVNDIASGSLPFNMPILGDNSTTQEVKIVNWQTSSQDQYILLQLTLEIQPS